MKNKPEFFSQRQSLPKGRHGTEGKEDIENTVLSVAAAYNPLIYTSDDVRRALDNAAAGGSCTSEAFGALLSPAAASLLEEMAFLAREEKIKRFGNSVSIFTPLYISNYCDNACVYCGFNKNNSIRRSKLGLKEIEEEMKAIAATGLEEILILAGESLVHAGPEYIAGALAIAGKYFRVLGLEVCPMDIDEYRLLRENGADFVTVFQETYDPVKYKKLHAQGRKQDFSFRFNAQERALKAGIRGVAFGSLLGLGDFRKDVFATGIHASLIQRKYPHAEISFSCPRLKPIINNNAPDFTEAGQTGKGLSENSVTFRTSPNEAELLQLICAFRLFMPFAGITISSRENMRFRNNAVQIAATRISAGVDVGIGRHAGVSTGDEQFEISDSRSVEEICQMLLSRGLQPVMSDYLDV